MIRSPEIFKITYTDDYSSAAAVITAILVSNDFHKIDDNMYTKISGSTGISIKFEQGMSRTIYIYAGMIEDFEYIYMTSSEKTLIDEIIGEIRSRLNALPDRSPGSSHGLFGEKEPVRKKGLLFSDFSITQYDDFSTFNCMLSNRTKYQYLNLGITFTFYNKFGTIIETGDFVINYLAPWQKKKITLMITAKQPISDFDISTSNE